MAFDWVDIHHVIRVQVQVAFCSPLSPGCLPKIKPPLRGIASTFRPESPKLPLTLSPAPNHFIEGDTPRRSSTNKRTQRTGWASSRWPPSRGRPHTWCQVLFVVATRAQGGAAPCQSVVLPFLWSFLRVSVVTWRWGLLYSLPFCLPLLESKKWPANPRDLACTQTDDDDARWETKSNASSRQSHSHGRSAGAGHLAATSGTTSDARGRSGGIDGRLGSAAWIMGRQPARRRSEAGCVRRRWVKIHRLAMQSARVIFIWSCLTSAALSAQWKAAEFLNSGYWLAWFLSTLYTTPHCQACGCRKSYL